jgi:4-hydroxy-4-methyl-2-oxoglutarate aldolase
MLAARQYAGWRNRFAAGPRAGSLREKARRALWGKIPPVLEDPPLLTIRRAWTRPKPEQLAKLAGVQTGQAVDAMDGRGGLDAAIKPIDPANAAFIGTAITCESGPNDNLAILGAMAMAKPGDVIMAAAEGFTQSAVVGDNLALCARTKGVAAIVLDTMARDLAGLLPVGLPIFGRGITPNSCVRSGPGRVGFPIVVGGVAVSPGDVVLGDRDGVVVVPQGQLEHFIGRVAEIQRMEEEAQRKIRGGFTNLGGIEDLLASSRVRWVD